MEEMKKIRFEDDGIATAVGMIFIIMIFVLLLSLFVTSYVPADMTSLEEQYSNNVMNEMIQLESTVNMLSLNYRQGEYSTVPFNLESGYIPLFSSPTIGDLVISGNGNGDSGFVYLNNSSVHIEAGGEVTAITNNRYYQDESFVYGLSSLFYEQQGTTQQVNSTLQYSFITPGLPSIGDINISINLVNLIGGPISFTGNSPFSLNIQIISKEIYVIRGNSTVFVVTPLKSLLYESTSSSILPLTKYYPSFSISEETQSNAMKMFLSSNNPNIPVSIYVTYISVIVSQG
jgi:hypothetical protein